MIEITDLLCSSGLSQDEEQELQSLLSQHRECRELFLRYCRMHAEIHLAINVVSESVCCDDAEFQSILELAREEGLPLEAPGALGTLLDGMSDCDSALTMDSRSHDIPSSPVLGILGGAHQVLRSPVGLLASFFLFATVAIAGLLYFQSDNQVGVGEPRNVAEETPDGSSSRFSARVTGMSVDCNWKNGMISQDDVSALKANQILDFENGVLEITFGDTSHVVLEGPVRFELLSRRSGRLERGRLFARAKPGFLIQTPGVTANDLGTEFGVLVNRSGGTRVDVIEGRVEVRGSAEIRRLRSGQAIAANIEGLISPELLVADGSSYIQTVPVNSLSQSVLRNRVAHWDFDDGLRDKSSKFVTDSIRGRKGVFSDTEDQPSWVFGDEAHRGAALQFNGGPGRIDLEMANREDVLGSAVTISAWVRIEVMPSELKDKFGAIYDSDEKTSEQDCYVLYLDRSHRELRFKVTTIDGKFYRIGIPEDYLIRGQWHHIVGVYDGERSRVLIYQDGMLQKFSDNTDLTEVVRPDQIPYVGMDFTGAIDDITVWSRALSSSEIIYLSKAFDKED